MNNKNKLNTKQKVIAGLVVLAIAGAIGTNFMGGNKVERHHSTASNAKTAQPSAKDAQQAHNKAETQARAIETTGATNNQLKGVESASTISIDNLAIKPEQADLMLYNAAVAGDLPTAKHLVEQGVKVSFTDNALCQYDFGPQAVLPSQASTMPANLDEMEKMIMTGMDLHRMSQRFIYSPTVCSKLFMQASLFKIQKQDQRETFYYYHNDDSVNATHSQSVSDQMKAANQAAMDVEERKSQMFKYFLSQMPAKDYEQLPGIFLDSRIPFSLRELALNKYLDDFGTTRGENAQKYQALYRDALNDLASKSPSDPNIADANSEAQNPFAPIMMVLLDELHTNATAYYTLSDGIKGRMKYDAKLATKELPEIAVADWEHGGISYQENPNSALWENDLNGKQAFKTLYELNGTLKLIKEVVDSGKFNINQQDASGNTILHYTVANLNNRQTNRTTATFVRYLLNKGADATLLNKKNLSPLEMVEQRQSAVGGNPDLIAPLMEVSKAFTDKQYK
ncbi:Ankyrin repeats (3 copies) [Caballeronia peredens]|nr:Ankyrin repeats (3 copies) [Caballeronia peredens]